jgi:ferredoxin
MRFDLNLGACIGCGRCVEVCPENALESVDAPRVVAALADGTPPLIDLLALGEK